MTINKELVCTCGSDSLEEYQIEGQESFIKCMRCGKPIEHMVMEEGEKIAKPKIDELNKLFDKFDKMSKRKV